MSTPSERLRDAIIRGNLPITKRLLARFPELWLNTDLTYRGYTNLHYASYYGHYLVCFHLVSLMGKLPRPVCHVDLTTFDNWLVLHMPVFHHHMQTFHLLLQEFSAREWVEHAGGPLMQTPLQLCCVHDFAEGMSLLLDFGADWNAQDKNGDTCLHLCFARGSTTCMEELIRFLATMRLRDVAEESSSGNAGDLERGLFSHGSRDATVGTETLDALQPLTSAETLSEVVMAPGTSTNTANTGNSDRASTPTHRPIPHVSRAAYAAEIRKSVHLSLRELEHVTNVKGWVAVDYAASTELQTHYQQLKELWISRAVDDELALHQPSWDTLLAVDSESWIWLPGHDPSNHNSSVASASSLDKLTPITGILASTSVAARSRGGSIAAVEVMPISASPDASRNIRTRRHTLSGTAPPELGVAPVPITPATSTDTSSNLGNLARGRSSTTGHKTAPLPQLARWTAFPQPITPLLTEFSTPSLNSVTISPRIRPPVGGSDDEEEIGKSPSEKALTKSEADSKRDVFSLDLHSSRDHSKSLGTRPRLTRASSNVLTSSTLALNLASALTLLSPGLSRVGSAVAGVAVQPSSPFKLRLRRETTLGVTGHSPDSVAAARLALDQMSRVAPAHRKAETSSNSSKQTLRRNASTPSVIGLRLTLTSADADKREGPPTPDLRKTFTITLPEGGTPEVLDSADQEKVNNINFTRVRGKV